MLTSFAGFSAATLYLATAVWLIVRISSGGVQKNKYGILALGFVAIALHIVTLVPSLFTVEGLNLGFYSTVSLTSLIIALLLWVAALGKPVESLGITILPLAGLSVVLDMTLPALHLFQERPPLSLEIHIMTSILAYSLLALAAAQAILLAVQDWRLRNRRPGGFVRALPPLETMEVLLFQAITLGFILHTLALLSGAVAVEDLFAQQVVHKTILSLIAWVLFAILLWGRWHFGWRGRVAIRWTLTAFFILLLAYFGSKLVLEVLLT